MTIALKMPALSPAMESGVLARWLVKEGDWIRSGDVIAEIETDKAVMEFEAVDEGMVYRLLVPAGDNEIAVGTTIALLSDRSEIERHVRVEQLLPTVEPVRSTRLVKPRDLTASVEISVVNANILDRKGGVLLVKHANGFYGVDATVATKCEFNREVERGEHVIVTGKGIGAESVMFLGVGELDDFRYERIKQFACDALKVLSDQNSETSVLLSPVHGSGYGLDEKESFLSLVSGFAEAIETGAYPVALQKIEIVELDAAKASRLSRFLVELLPEDHEPGGRTPLSRKLGRHGGANEQGLTAFGAASEAKPKLFVAMPFTEELDDVWKIGIQEACSSVDILCERIDEKKFVGSVVEEIKKSLLGSRGVIAVLDGANANVFLELGFAWALGRPTILIARSADKLPFDVRGQRCIIYRGSVHRLREELRNELAALMGDGTLS